MNISSFCNEISAVKKVFNEKLSEMRADFLQNYVLKNIVSQGDTIYDEDGLKFRVHGVSIIETNSRAMAIETIGYRVLKSGYISRRGFVKMVTMFNSAGECVKNEIVKVENV